MDPQSRAGSARISAKVKELLKAASALPCGQEGPPEGIQCSRITADFAMYSAGVDTALLVTASVEGQPYVHCQRGPKGFVKALNSAVVGFPYYAPKTQSAKISNDYIENDSSILLLLDSETSVVIQIYGESILLENNAELAELLARRGSGASPRAAVLFAIKEWVINGV